MPESPDLPVPSEAWERLERAAVGIADHGWLFAEHVARKGHAPIAAVVALREQAERLAVLCREMESQGGG